jgi:hypothetical protein
MPITFNCACGTTLRVGDGLAGKQARCPKCQSAVTIPAADVDPGFEVVDDPPPPRQATPALAKAASKTSPPADDRDDDRPSRRRTRDDEEDDDRPSRRRPRDEEDDEDEGVVRRRRRRAQDDDDDDDDRSRRRRRGKKREEHSGFWGTEKGIINGGVGVGLLTMLIAVIWLVVGLMAGWLFYYPPVLFVVGLIALIKGLVNGGGGGQDDD